MNRLRISIHAPRVGRDYRPKWQHPAEQRFQSTRPAWGATNLVQEFAATIFISIHAPRVGRDAGYRIVMHVHDISIHAPRVGRDDTADRPQKDRTHFNPRAPRGARQRAWHRFVDTYAFQSTRPAWGATPVPKPCLTQRLFQSTRPAWGATTVITISCMPVTFQSTRPAWGATQIEERIAKHIEISIHAPRVGRDGNTRCGAGGYPDFNPRAPRGARPNLPKKPPKSYRFQSTRPAWGATEANRRDQRR